LAAQPQDFAKLVRVGILNIVFQFNVKFNQSIENKMNNILEYYRCKNEYNSFKQAIFRISRWK
tara:strand:- start:296 stop:484 length:189 start_codon:yes stop_codon:yes gene_type:complete